MKVTGVFYYVPIDSCQTINVFLNRLLQSFNNMRYTYKSFVDILQRSIKSFFESVKCTIGY